jgi:hypothetical protein
VLSVGDWIVEEYLDKDGASQRFLNRIRATLVQALGSMRLACQRFCPMVEDPNQEGTGLTHGDPEQRHYSPHTCQHSHLVQCRNARISTTEHQHFMNIPRHEYFLWAQCTVQCRKRTVFLLTLALNRARPTKRHQL